jgi:hypothetical protein
MTAGTRHPARTVCAVLLGLVVAAAATALVQARGEDARPSAPLALRSGSTAGSPAAGPVVYAVTARASVDIRVSAAYPDAAERAQQWSTFFAGLPHGAELGTLRVNVVSEPELATACSARALGCYRMGELTIAGDAVGGVTPEEVARHEYGHHLAANRSNAPWRAVDWGPKRWATAVGVCADVQKGAAFPGDEDERYTENPGEAWAEVYRVLAEQAAGRLTGIWSVVATRYFPSEAVLAAAREDVVHPWTAPSLTRIEGELRKAGPWVWQRRLATPLDGTLVVKLTMPVGARHDIAVVDPNGGKVLARWSTWTTRSRTITTTVCGQRAVLLRVTRGTAAGPFSLVVSRP